MASDFDWFKRNLRRLIASKFASHRHQLNNLFAFMLRESKSLSSIIKRSLSPLFCFFLLLLCLENNCACLTSHSLTFSTEVFFTTWKAESFFLFLFLRCEMFWILSYFRLSYYSKAGVREEKLFFLSYISRHSVASFCCHENLTKIFFHENNAQS